LADESALPMATVRQLHARHDVNSAALDGVFALCDSVSHIVHNGSLPAIR
jgi:hypothetical protein